MSDASTPATPPAPSLQRLGAAALGLLHGHVELFGIELQEQKARTVSLLLFAGLALVFALLINLNGRVVRQVPPLAITRPTAWMISSATACAPAILRSAMPIFAPALARLCAISLPMPLAAPVTMATLPSIGEPMDDDS